MRSLLSSQLLILLLLMILLLQLLLRVDLGLLLTLLANTDAYSSISSSDCLLSLLYSSKLSTFTSEPLALSSRLALVLGGFNSSLWLTGWQLLWGGKNIGLGLNQSLDDLVRPWKLED